MGKLRLFGAPRGSGALLGAGPVGPLPASARAPEPRPLRGADRPLLRAHGAVRPFGPLCGPKRPTRLPGGASRRLRSAPASALRAPHPPPSAANSPASQAAAQSRAERKAQQEARQRGPRCGWRLGSGAGASAAPGPALLAVRGAVPGRGSCPCPCPGAHSSPGHPQRPAAAQPPQPLDRPSRGVRCAPTGRAFLQPPVPSRPLCPPRGRGGVCAAGRAYALGLSTRGSGSNAKKANTGD